MTQEWVEVKTSTNRALLERVAALLKPCEVVVVRSGWRVKSGRMRRLYTLKKLVERKV